MVRISNLELLKILRKNSRIPFLKIAKALGASETAIRKRIRKLERDGVIRKYTIDVDPKKIGFEIDVFIGIDVKPEYYISTLERLKNMSEIINLYSTSGDHMFIIECWFRDTKELTKFVEALKKLEGITRVCPAIILEKIK